MAQELEQTEIHACLSFQALWIDLLVSWLMWNTVAAATFTLAIAT